MKLEERVELIKLLGVKPELLDNPLITERAKRIFQDRYGLPDGKTKTLEEVGKMYGVTRERIRQIEAKVLEIIRLTCKDLDLNI